MVSTAMVYHFTDTARLPWILQSGELRPGANRIGGYPDPDFLWATTDVRGSRSASAHMQGYRSGLTRVVRFTLHADDFEAWHEIVRRYPAWTPHQIGRLERSAKDQPMFWRCRVEPLPRARWIEIATKSYIEHEWRPLAAHINPQRCGDALGLAINGTLYLSRRNDPGPGGAIVYHVLCR